VIPRADIQEWRAGGTPWKTDAMVEQDLIISRVLVELFADQHIGGGLIFRGGTALHKLFFSEPLRYSEDIDLVQSHPGPIGPIFDAIRRLFVGWLGEPKRKIGPDMATLTYRIESEDSPPLPLRIKIEINIREHEPFLAVDTKIFKVESRWFQGKADVAVYCIEELLATKLRALYQRRKGRDLFDLAHALRELKVDAAAVVKTFEKYIEAEGNRVTASDLRKNIEDKLNHPGFVRDCHPIIRPGVSIDLNSDYALIDRELLVYMS
jgi:predicted nucleotidyltransferase component of viral defense system